MNPDLDQLLLLSDQMAEWAKTLRHEGGGNRNTLLGIIAGLEDVVRDVRRYVKVASKRPWGEAVAGAVAVLLDAMVKNPKVTATDIDTVIRILAMALR